MQPMTREQYKNNGYNLSVNIEQSVIDRAERDAFASYVAPILPSAAISDESICDELCDIAYLLIMQRTLRVTRTGTKQKNSADSMNANDWAALNEQATTAAAAVERLRKMSGAVEGAKVCDVAKIYFKTNYFCI